MRALLCLACLALPLLARAQAAGGDYKAGDRIEILYDSKWYPGAVVKAGDNKWLVHYDAWDVGRETRLTDLKGTYDFSGHELTTFEDGKLPNKTIAFPMWVDGEPENHVYIDEGIHIRKK